jgi:hypothetical protein
LVRALLAAPLVTLAVLAANAGWVSPPHALLLGRSAAVAEAGSVAAAVDLFYPPIPTAVALLTGSAVGLSVVASFFAAMAFHASLERMVRRRVPHVLTAVLLLAVVAPPAVWYLATQDLAGIGGLALLVLALEAFVRFAFNDETAGGFTAGLLLAAAFLFTPVAVVYAVTLALAAPLLAWARHRGERAAVRATIAVLCMPTFALVAALLFMQWRFAGNLLPASVEALRLFDFPGGVWNALGAALSEVATSALRSPIYLAVGILLIARKPLAGVGYLLPLVGLTLTLWAGFDYSTTRAVLLLSLVAIATIPFRPTGSTRWILYGAALLQVAVNYDTEVLGWLNLF